MALVLVCFAVAPTHAQLPEHVELAWQDDAACPRPLRLSLESEIARLLGPSARTVPPARFAVQVRRSPDSPARPYRLTLQSRSGSSRGERELLLGSCADAQDAAALLIATAIDPGAVMRAPPPREEPPPTVAQPRTPPVRSHAWSLLARGLLDGRTLPTVTAGLEAGVLFARARHRLWSGARYLFARPSERSEGSGVGADLDLFSAAAGGAYVWPFGDLVVGPAVELELGVLRARGVVSNEGVSPRNRAAPWAAAALGGVAGYAVHRRVGVELSLLAGLPLWRPRLSVRDEGPFYTTSWWTMRVAVGVRVSLGSL